MLHDLRFAFRSLRRRPAFTAVAVVTLALALGAGAALFAVADAVLFKPLPYPDLERVVRIEGAPFAFSSAGMTLSRLVVENDRFRGAGMYADGGVNAGSDDALERMPAAAVSAGFFPAMGTPPVIGRPFTAEEVAAGARVAVISHRAWARFFADGRTTGLSMSINGRPYAVVGVMPPRFDFPSGSSIWIPINVDRQITGPAFAPSVVARLAPGVTFDAARAEIERINAERRPAGTEARPVTVRPLADELVGSARPLFAVVAVAVLLVLLVAWINTANLLLTRLSSRSRELAIRRALGASRGRLVRHVVAEGAIVSAAGGVLALAAAAWTIGAVTLLVPGRLHGADAIAIDARAAVVTGLFCVVSTLLVSLAPIWSLGGRPSVSGLRDGAATPSRAWGRVRAGLVAAEVAAAVVILAGAVALVRTVSTLTAIDLGASGERVWTMQLTLPEARYGAALERDSFALRLRAALQVPQVEAVGAVTAMPGTTETGIGLAVLVDGLPAPAGDGRFGSLLGATPDYFRAADIRLIAGREFDRTDRHDAPRVAIVSAGVARLLGVDPRDLPDRRINLGFGTEVWATIAGVVDDVRLRGPERESGAQIYQPLGQSPLGGSLTVAVQVRPDATGVPDLLRHAVGSVDAGLPPFNVRPFDDIRTAFIADRRFAMVMLLAFAILSGALALIGLHGVVAYAMQLRQREMALRLALGATRRVLVSGEMLRGLSPAAVGVAIGAVGAVLGSRVLSSRIAGVDTLDAATVATLGVAALTLAAAAVWLPAFRASRLDAATVLRGD
jgi:predicted permease